MTILPVIQIVRVVEKRCIVNTQIYLDTIMCKHETLPTNIHIVYVNFLYTYVYVVLNRCVHISMKHW